MSSASHIHLLTHTDAIRQRKNNVVSNKQGRYHHHSSIYILLCVLCSLSMTFHLCLLSSCDLLNHLYRMFTPSIYYLYIMYILSRTNITASILYFAYMYM